jgi:hypothetical protein
MLRMRAPRSRSQTRLSWAWMQIACVPVPLTREAPTFRGRASQCCLSTPTTRRVSRCAPKPDEWVHVGGANTFGDANACSACEHHDRARRLAYRGVDADCLRSRATDSRGPDFPGPSKSVLPFHDHDELRFSLQYVDSVLSSAPAGAAWVYATVHGLRSPLRGSLHPWLPPLARVAGEDAEHCNGFNPLEFLHPLLHLFLRPLPRPEGTKEGSHG